ncbi:DUF2793 domain-containing protein [Sphingomonas sp.]|uniref:DUF2793 domain-containing protein n=1 Tax=Sphingomonas sp. TaxID=28214 RepID=UPI0035C83AC1
MSEDQTPRFALPVLHIGQADKEQTHNEALALIDLAMGAVVEDVGIDVPPGDLQPGQCWIVGDAPTGAWAGNARAIAGWTAGGWRFVAARAGLSAWCRAWRMPVTFHDAWERGVLRAERLMVDGEQVVASRQPDVPLPTGGGVVDAEARAAVTSVIAALRTHGLIG